MNGDSARGTLRLSGIAGDTTVWADVLHDGPVPDVPPEELRRLRGFHIASDAAGGEYTESGVVQTLENWDEALERFADYDEVVFWFEHDLFDQLILIRHLHWLSGIDPAHTKFTLICIGEFPGIPGFGGLGELTPPQLASLFPSRQPITAEQIELGRRAWNLFRAPQPEGLLALVGNPATAALPFLDGALRRHFEDFPSSSTGLSRSESQILRAAAEGRSAPVDIFLTTQGMEERIFMGDLTFWTMMQGLAAAAHPLLTIAPQHTPLPIKDGRVRLTPAGEAVLAGRADHVALNGIDKWMGGCHLTTDRHWRWDGGRLIHVNSKLQTSNSKSRSD
jgi:hypothetical protein